MNESFEHPIRKANPGTFQSDDEVIRQFVVRERELAIVLEVLKTNVDASSCQHVLLVAPRGRGKTMLLARVAAELRTNARLARHLLPVRFMEDSHEIFDMTDFWLECLFYLAREGVVRDSPIGRGLLDTHAALAARVRGEELTEPRARAAVLDAADRLGRKLVFMVENLQNLCADVDEHFGWKLREALQSEPRIMLLATATSRFKGLDDATEPFFELFRSERLDRLDTEESRRLWRVISGDLVPAREIRPLQILTGGSPRLIVFVADFARHRSLRQLMEQLVRLIDDHTEYFRSHLEGFAKTERRVYLAILDLWQPSTPREITSRARLDVRTVSTMLSRLVDRGAVIAEGGGRKRLYSGAERLYGIYYKLRRERDDAAVVSNLIRFMAVFYSAPELAQMIDNLSMEAAQSPSILEGISDSAELQLEVAMALVNKGVRQRQLDDSKAAIATYDQLVSRYGDSDSPELQARVAKALSAKGVVLIRLGRPEEAQRTCAELERAHRSPSDSNYVTFRQRAMWLRTKALLLQGKRNDAIEAFRNFYVTHRHGSEATLKDMIGLAIDLTASGCRERALLEIVMSDEKKSDELSPLVVALRRRAGEVVRAPVEVMEVADDIIEQIKAKMSADAPPQHPPA